jgi:hypothetical protein
VEQRAQCVDVRARIELTLPERLLRTHVRRCAERHAGFRQSPLSASRGDRDPKIGHERSSLVQQDVLGLDVAMDDAVPMRVVEGARDFGCDAHGVAYWKPWLSRNSLSQRLAVHERHHVKQRAVGLSRVEERQDVRMLQLRGRADLLEESIGAEQRCQIRMQHVQGDAAIVPDIVREPDRGQASGAELALDDVSVAQRLREASVDWVSRRAVSCQDAGALGWPCKCARRGIR